MKSKKLFLSSVLCGVLSLVVSGCSSLNGESDSPCFTSIVVSSGNSNRAVDSSSISYTKVTVSGTGISESNEPSALAPVNNGAASCITVEKVPVGKNRIISAYALNESKNKIGTCVVRAVADIYANHDQQVSVNWETSAAGNLFYQLHQNKVDISRITETDKNLLLSAIPSDVHSAMVDVSRIASDFQEKTLAQDNTSYIMEPASLSLSTNFWSDFSIQVCDPCSSVKTDCSSGVSSVEGIAPGVWSVYLIKDGEVKAIKTCRFTSGAETEVTFDQITDKILLHVYNYTHIWCYSDKTEQSYNTVQKWPGDEMPEDTVDGWFTYTINQESAKVIFSKSGSNQTGNGDLVVAGEYWYKNGVWYTDDPIDTENPSIDSVTPSQSGTVSGEVTIIVKASDNKGLSKAWLYVKSSSKANGSEAEKLVSTVKFSELDNTVSLVWDSSCYKNDEYTLSVKVTDTSDNESEAYSFNLNAENENRAPVAVITGPSQAGMGKTKTFKATGSRDPNGYITSYSWKVSGGASIVEGADSSKVTVQFPSSNADCTLTLTVKDDDGAVASASKVITVKELSKSDFREETIYFAMTTRFYDGDTGNNVHCWDENASTPADDPAWRGDFKGLIEKLDYIKALGFTAVWITPVVENCSGLDYHGYHAMNFSKVDPRYESEDVDFQTLIDEVHARGMKIVLDVVFNHTGNFGEATLAPMFEKDYSADLADINACLKLSENSLLDESYWNLSGDNQYARRLSLMKNTDYQNHDVHNYYHHFGFGNWDNFSVQFFQMAGDCVDLNTENPKVLKYIGDAYCQYIEMGVDAFRIDTGKHLSRLEFNYYLNDRFIEAAQSCGNESFFMFTEICAKSTNVTYRGNVENLSPYFYTWMDDQDYGFTMNDEDQFEGVIILPEANDVSNDNKDETRVLNDLTYWTRETVDGGTKTPVNALAVQKQGMDTTDVRANRPESKNHLLNGNTYHEPDYSKFSGLNVIDFPMHWNFASASGAYSVRGGDKYYNDATWNVVYVDSHDYGPDGQYEQRYNGEAIDWAENINLMFTFRGIPCIYYGSEIGFMKGAIIDKGPIMPLCETGRAYFGDYLKGQVTATDFSEYTATGEVAETLNHPLAKHIQRMNKIRRSVPALQKGQYSTDNCSGGMCFKRRYTKDGTDSFVLVTLSGDAVFSGLPAGTYLDVVTGDKKVVSEGGSISTSGCTGKGNARIYVLQNSTASAYGADNMIGEATTWMK